MSSFEDGIDKAYNKYLNEARDDEEKAPTGRELKAQAAWDDKKDFVAPHRKSAFMGGIGKKLKGLRQWAGDFKKNTKEWGALAPFIGASDRDSKIKGQLKSQHRSFTDKELRQMGYNQSDVDMARATSQYYTNDELLKKGYSQEDIDKARKDSNFRVASPRTGHMTRMQLHKRSRFS